MDKYIIRGDTRGKANYSWLSANYTFSFADYYNKERVHFGLLRVLNDDIIQPGEGFDTHPHDNMEIVTIPITGSIRHQDSTGETGIIGRNDIQIMSAGTGVMHSEFNASDTEIVNTLQIWVYPKIKNITPVYDQLTLHDNLLKNQFFLGVSPEKSDKTLFINQDAYFSLADIDEGIQLTYKLQKTNHGVYIFIIEGAAETCKELLNSRDGMGVSGVLEISIKATQKSRVLFIEVPLH